MAVASPSSHTRRFATTDNRSLLSPRGGRDNIRSTLAIRVRLSKRSTSLKLLPLHGVCSLQSATLELLKLNTSLTVGTDATSFWTSIQGFGPGLPWVAARA